MQIIAIDGFSGAGKSTIADIVAEKLGYLHLNTGDLYRAVAIFAIDNGYYDNELDLLKNLDKFDYSISFDGGIQNNILCGININNRLRTEEVSLLSSIVAKNQKVRQLIKSIQLNVAKNINLVIDGRDIGSEIFPETKNKYFITASVCTRAKRRNIQNKNTEENFDEVLRDLLFRDKQDLTRNHSPLTLCRDAIIIDNTYISAQECADQIIKGVLL